MNGSSVTLDKVVIDINARATDAGGNIANLTQTLNELKGAVKGGFNNLSKLAQSLNELKASTKNLNDISSKLDSLKNIGEALSSLSSIPTPTGLKSTISSLEKLPNTFGKINTTSLENMTRVSKELASALTPLANKMGQISQGYSAINSLADKYGVAATKIRTYTKQNNDYFKRLSQGLSTVQGRLQSTFKNTETFFKRFSRNSASITSKIKQIGLSLLGTRTIFTATRKAVSEYMAMDAELSWQLTNNWRALGAQLAPAIEYVMYVFKQFIRVIYSVILALTGIDLIARANEKAMKGWGKAAKDTLGNLQKFDDLNVVEFPKGSGNDDDKLIELDTIDLSPIQKVIDWVRKLRDEIKEAWSSGQWEGVGKVLAEGLNDGMRAIKFDVLQEKLKGVAMKFGDFLRGAINEFDASLFGEKLTEALVLIPRALADLFDNIPWTDFGRQLNKALTTFSPTKIINAIGDAFVNFFGGLQDAFLQIDAGVLGLKITDTIVSVFKNIHKFFDRINWDELGKKIRDTITSINWSEVWSTAVSAFGDAFDDLKSFASSLTGLDPKTIDTIANAFVKIGAAFVTYKIVDGISIFADKILAIATSPIGVIVGGIVVIVQLFKDIIDIIKDPKAIENWEKLTHDIILFGSVAAVLLIAFFAMKKFNSGIGEAAKTTKDLAKGGGLTSLFGDLGKAAEIIAVLGGLALVLHEITNLLQVMHDTGTSVGDIMATLGVVFLTIAGLMGAIVVLGPSMTAGLVPFSVLMAELSAILIVMAATLPIILDAVAEFIERTAPMLNSVLNTIGDNINKIIRALGETLPPIINSVGNLFDKIFTGIEKIIRSVGDTIVKIMETADRTIASTLQSIIRFIRDLGPAIETFVNSAINSVTRLIRFVLYGIEYLINSVLTDGINAFLRSLNKVPGVDIPLLEDVHLRPFNPPQLEVGTNEIEYEGLYHLHQGEAVVPKKYNPALSGGTNEETNRRLDMLIDIIGNIDTTTIVNIGNDQLYKQQKKYTDKKVNKYGTSAVE